MMVAQASTMAVAMERNEQIQEALLGLIHRGDCSITTKEQS